MGVLLHFDTLTVEVPREKKRHVWRLEMESILSIQQTQRLLRRPIN